MDRPDWMDKEPREWPASARIAYGILLQAAMRRMAGQGPPTERHVRPVKRRRPEPG